MQQINTITANATQARDLALPNFNPYMPGTSEHEAYEKGWAAQGAEANWIDALPAVFHPYTEYSLQDAVRLAVSNRQIQQLAPPTNLVEARQVIQDMASRGGMWMTGMAALDVLDAAIDGRDLRQSCRFV